MLLSFCVTHKNTNEALLEALSFQNTSKALKSLISLDFVDECVLIQTCNRVELHIVTSNESQYMILEKVVKFWSQTTNVSTDTILKVIEVFEGRESLHHLLLLASGLESMVVGEDQILGQIHKAHLEAKEAGTTKSFIDTVFNKAVNVGRNVRVKTRINKGSVSVSSIAIDLAEKHLDNQASTKALVIGAGKIGELAAKEMSNRKIGPVYICNRTYHRSVKLAKKIDGKPIRFEEFYDFLPRVNLIIAAVQVTEPILTYEKVKEVLKTGKLPQLLLIDLSHPRCIEEDVGRISGVNLKTIDDLKETAEENLNKRLHEANKAKELIIEELNHLETLLKKMVAEPTISNLCKKMEKIRRVETSKAFKMINGIDEDQRQIIDDLTRALVEKILQSPIENLRNATLNGESQLLLAANSLFNLKSKK
jgi:glutamyl-tRNA reductase